MRRLARPDNPRLETLLDQRDHIRIQISMLGDAELPDPERLRQLRAELAEVKNEISRHKRVY